MKFTIEDFLEKLETKQIFYHLVEGYSHIHNEVLCKKTFVVGELNSTLSNLRDIIHKQAQSAH